MAQIQSGDNTTNLLTINDNKEALVNPPLDPATAGFVNVAASGQPLEATEDGHLLVSEDTVVFFDQIDGNAVDLTKWNPYDVSGMTITQANGFITLNAGAATTANAYALLKTVEFIPLYPEFPTFAALDLKLNVQPQANVTIRYGFGNPSGASAPTDGVYYQLDPDGTMKCVTVNGGGTPTPATIPALSVNVMHDYDISIEVDDANFIVDDNDNEAVAIENPSGNPFCVGTARLPMFLQVVCGSSAPGTAPQMSLGRISVIQKTLRPNRPWREIMTILGRGSYQSPVSAFGQTANWTNSAAPSTRALSNVTPCETTLGGLLRFTPTYVADTDYILFAYTVPTGYKLIVEGIWYNSPRYFSGTAGITGSTLQFGVAFDGSAASLATADGSGAWAHRRMVLGLSQLAATPTLLTVPSDVGQNIYPIRGVVHSGRVLAFLMRPLLARTAGASEVHQLSFGVDGYFE